MEGSASDLTPPAEPGSEVSSPERLFTERRDTYVRFVRAVRYPQGLRAFFLRSPLLRAGLRILDAGCGTGILTLAVHEALVRRGLTAGQLHAFDLTPAMLQGFRDHLRARRVNGVEAAQANVLELQALPDAWTQYDVIVSASMLEYVPRSRFVDALRGLRDRLADDGTFILFITRRNWLTRPLIGRWWNSNLYDADELREAVRRAGFSHCRFRRFPLSACHLRLWGYIVEARR